MEPIDTESTVIHDWEDLEETDLFADDLEERYNPATVSSTTCVSTASSVATCWGCGCCFSCLCCG